MADAQAADKRAAAEAAIAEVQPGMIVGLGTGSTAAFAIAALGERVRDGLEVTAVATSLATERAARAAGVRVIDFADVSRVDLTIDGADEIDPQFRAIKGAGGALLREKIVARAATRMICIVDPGKLVERLGERPVPLEVLPFARSFVAKFVESLGGSPVLRRDAGGTTATSDQGNILIDCDFGSIADPYALGEALQAVPGILGHGLFLTEIDAIFAGATIRRDRGPGRR